MSSNRKILWLSLGLLALLVPALLAVGLKLRRDVGLSRATGYPLPGVVAELHPDLEAALDALAAGDPARAKQLFEGVPPTHPSYTLALDRLARLAEQAGDTEASLSAYGKLIEVQPEQPAAYLGVTRVLLGGGRYDEAELAALQAIEIAPGDLSARYAVALVRVAQGRTEDALQSYRRAFRMDPSSNGVAGAEVELRGFRDRNPSLASAHYALAYFASVRGETAREIEELERYLALVSSGPMAERARARLDTVRPGG